MIERAQLSRVLLRGALTFLVSALLAAPLAIAWGVGRAQVDDYLGANQVSISVDYTSETRIDLGPLGNAYLPLDYGPVGLTITVQGIRQPTTGSILSQDTLQSYLVLYNSPREVIVGIRDSLVVDAVQKAVVAELLLVLIMIGWTQRKHFLSERLVRMSRAQQGVLAYVVLIVVVGAVAIAPPAKEPSPRYGVPVAEGTPLEGMTVDSSLLADLIDRGVKGVRAMAERQNDAIDDYVTEASGNLIDQSADLPAPEAGEDMLLGMSDLHCSMAMTRVWTQVVNLTGPSQLFSSGDDTMNGTASEQPCATAQRAIAGDRPFVDIGGNHDTAVTERQMKAVGMTVLNGKVLDVDGTRYLGDDDPDYNPPLSMERIRERPETQVEMAERLMKIATGRNVDILLVHQPNAARVITQSPNPPAKLIAWGHMHTQVGPQVITHEDGSWTVTLQMGTAGGVAAPTITSFSTPFSPPRKSADGYFFFRDRATGLITGVQPIHFLPDGSLIIEDRIPTGDLSALPPETRTRLGGAEASEPATPGTATPGTATPKSPRSGAAR